MAVVPSLSEAVTITDIDIATIETIIIEIAIVAITTTARAGWNIGAIVPSISTVVRVDITALYPSTKT